MPTRRRDARQRRFAGINQTPDASWYGSERPGVVREGTCCAFPKSRLPVFPYKTDTFFHLCQEDAKRSLLKLKAVEKKLRQVAGAIAAVDTATGALRHLVQGVDVEEALDVMNDTQDINGFDFGNGNGNLFQTLVPASLAESREGPTRGRRVSFEANASLGNVSDIPASAEAVPVTAPVPTGRRRATRLRGN